MLKRHGKRLKLLEEHSDAADPLAALRTCIDASRAEEQRLARVLSGHLAQHQWTVVDKHHQEAGEATQRMCEDYYTRCGELTLAAYKPNRVFLGLDS